jgi:hypothetical protein
MTRLDDIKTGKSPIWMGIRESTGFLYISANKLDVEIYCMSTLKKIKKIPMVAHGADIRGINPISGDFVVHFMMVNKRTDNLIVYNQEPEFVKAIKLDGMTDVKCVRFNSKGFMYAYDEKMARVYDQEYNFLFVFAFEVCSMRDIRCELNIDSFEHIFIHNMTYEGNHIIHEYESDGKLIKQHCYPYGKFQGLKMVINENEPVWFYLEVIRSPEELKSYIYKMNVEMEPI